MRRCPARRGAACSRRGKGRDCAGHRAAERGRGGRHRAGWRRGSGSRREALREDIRVALEEGEPASAVAKRLSQKYSRRKRDVYAMVLDMQ